MSDYELYCFAESGNAYKAALMLELCAFDWDQRFVDFFKGETRTPDYRKNINEMGEVPVLVHGNEKLTQSGVILEYLAERSGKFGPATPAGHREILRWILFDNHKFTSYVATLRFMIRFMKSGETPVTEFLRQRAKSAFSVVNKHLDSQTFIAGESATIADISLCGYLFFDDELTIDLGDYPSICKWLERIKDIPGWKHPYDLMQRGWNPE